MTSARPNLFLMGAMKSGTTFLSDVLGSHPEIFMSTPKEPSYFVSEQVLRTIWPHMWSKGYWRSERAYLELFAGARDATIVGEASTNYSKLPLIDGVPEKILAFSPGARFIYLMRDPIERAISHYWHMVYHHAESRPMLEAIQSDRHLTDVSYYALQLQAYLKHVEMDRLYMLTFEELVRNPLTEINKLYAWLGVGPANEMPVLTKRANVTPEVLERASGFGILHRFRDSAMYSWVAPGLPAKLRSFGARLAAEKIRPKKMSTSEVVDYLRPIQQRQTYELSALLGREFSEWTTLYGAGRQHN